MRRASFILALLVAVAAGASLFQLSYRSFRAQELAQAEGRLSLYQSTVRAELERFSHLAYVMANDPFVIATAAGAGTGPLNRRLQDFASQAGVDAIYLMDADGLTIAASNHHEPRSFVGQSYGFRPYFQDAIAGGQGRFYAIGATTGEPGYFIADAVQEGTPTPTGVIAIKLDFSSLQDSWRAAGEQVLLANEDGVVLLASDPAWQYRSLQPLSADQRNRIIAAKQFPGERLEPLDWTPQPDNVAGIGGQTSLYLQARALPHGWSLHYFASDDRATARAWLVTALFLLVAGASFIVWQIGRTRRVGAALARSEQEEAQLRLANERLAQEIEVRRTAERRLKRTQGELERASKLAALGQLAASVTHELGQPIAAMRNHLVAAEFAPAPPARLPGQIASLVDRMEGITRQLRFFARSEQEPFGDVDLNVAVQAALSLVAPNVEKARAAVALDLPDQPVLIRGISLRVEQVLTNLLRNALDATDEVDAPELAVSVRLAADSALVEVQDNGHGLGDATLADLQEPFVTTRESGRGPGQGMGLGLAISASIVKDHNGTMTARNRKAGGTIFTVTFPRPHSEDDLDA
ncbi:C4-dicarboxylate transport sensor protein DctB [Tritonibacter multivorans]|uniref:histidine kinase n=1 Tax=Tritonibacter multivorans TaxID=928856 RepID=A0A0P1GTS8_9RHOB|nr:ATP-binding protein [Tritonibacter multivorans]MDA7421749.1 ATP-binding protein [Tritonibacter multivorans]CUH77975.1 C4-dicarboxylate transport sensor protein DctB [Tritonibacter multivorans]SFD04550.1 two-component system, NtrC family, C4-dicarboxylate transport sensor histidine kinase DctB [Tritonibacter multivorans]